MAKTSNATLQAKLDQIEKIVHEIRAKVSDSDKWNKGEPYTAREDTAPLRAQGFDRIAEIFSK